MKKVWSLCPICYRHLESTLFEEDNFIKMNKTCPVHGEMNFVVENNLSAYERMETKTDYGFNVVMFESTNRCNLNCPHCYHIPNNKSSDKSIDSIINEIKPIKNNFLVMLAGAEPTVREDIHELIKEIKLTLNKPVALLTNGIKFHDKEFSKKVVDAGMEDATIGVNHWSYQGMTVHEKQLEGLANLKSLGLVPNVGYTLDSYEHLPDVLKETKDLFIKGEIDHVRLRFGVNIGRSPGEPLKTLSDYLKAVKSACDEMKTSYYELPLRQTLYYKMVMANDVPIRVTQWPEADNIVIEETQNRIWAKFYNGPITSFLHQIIMRDAFVNKKLQKLDDPPEKFTFQS